MTGLAQSADSSSMLMEKAEFKGNDAGMQAHVVMEIAMCLFYFLREMRRYNST
jgi:hypothetical protein